MKNQFWIVVMILLSIAVCGKAAGDRAIGAGSIHVGIVVDCGRADTSTWETIRARAIEMVCLLKPGDRITIINAYPSEARLFESAELLSDNKTPIDSMVRRLGTLSKEWFARSDISAAVGLSYEKLIFEPSTRNCCIVLTSGDITDDQVRSLSRLAVMFKAKNWPIVVACNHAAANRRLLVSDIAVRYLDNPGISEWISGIRPVIRLKAEPNIPDQSSKRDESRRTAEPNSLANQKPDSRITSEKILAPASNPDMSKRRAGKRDGGPDSNSMAAGSKAVSDPNVTHGKTDKPDSNSRTVKPPGPGWRRNVYRGKAPLSSSEKASPIDANKVPPDANSDRGAARSDPCVNNSTNKAATSAKKPDHSKTKTRSFWRRMIAQYGVTVLVGMVVVIAIVVIIVNYRNAKTSVDKTDNGTVSDDAFSIIAIKDDDRYDLGIETSIRSLVFGSSPESAIPLAGEGIESEEFVLRNKGSDFEIKNISSHVLNVNGVPLKPKKKLIIVFPMSVQSENGLNLVVARENSTKINEKEGTHK